MAWLEEKNKYLGGIPNSWLVIATVFVIFFTGLGAGLRARYNLPSGQDVLGIEDVDDWVGDTSLYKMNSITIDFEIDQSDWQAGGTATPTTPVYSYFYTEPSEGDTGIGITVGGEDITVMASNDGIIWIDAYGGTDFYLVESVIRGSNPEVVGTKVVDWDGDDSLDFLIKMDLSRFLKDEAQYKQTYVMEMPLLDLDVTGITTDNPADQTGVGVALVTQTITWKVSGLTAEDGFFISELYILTNDTVKGNDFTLKSMTISGSHTIIGTSGGITLQPIHTSIGGAYGAYYVEATQTSEPLESDVLQIFRDTNMGDELYITLQVQVDYEANDDGLIDIVFYTVDPAGNTAQVTDQVELES